MLCGKPDSDGMDPSNEYCANKHQGLKPPQETTTTCLLRSEIENKLPKKEEKTDKLTLYGALCES